jgi:hypothetical protein
MQGTRAPATPRMWHVRPAVLRREQYSPPVHHHQVTPPRALQHLLPLGPRRLPSLRSSPAPPWQALMADFRLMLDNCQAYNPRSSDWHEVAAEFRAVGKKIEADAVLELMAASQSLGLPAGV